MSASVPSICLCTFTTALPILKPTVILRWKNLDLISLFFFFFLDEKKKQKSYALDSSNKHIVTSNFWERTTYFDKAGCPTVCWC